MGGGGGGISLFSHRCGKGQEGVERTRTSIYLNLIYVKIESGTLAHFCRVFCLFSLSK